MACICNGKSRDELWIEIVGISLGTPDEFNFCPSCGRDLRLPVARVYEDAERLARRFHDTYERLAPSFGYETREDTKSFDPESKNGRLMIAVVGEYFGPVTVSPEVPE